MADDTLIPARALFRFELSCLKHAGAWTAKGAGLGPAHRLPNLAALEGRGEYADVRVGWNDKGLFFSVRVAGKQKSPWCRANQAARSDGLHIWIDTRDTHNVHRATRFCHSFALLPGGEGPLLTDPLAILMLINRARDNPKHVPPQSLKVRSTIAATGYELEAFIPGEVLTGFDPAEHPKLGFTYAVRDSELGDQTFCAPATLPYTEDPSLWCTLELVDG